MAHGSADPSIELQAENSPAGMGKTDHLAGATINLLGQLGKPMLLGEKIRGVIYLFIHVHLWNGQMREDSGTLLTLSKLLVSLLLSLFIS